MPQFRNIVVGIDIAQLEEPGTAKFTPPVEEAIRCGIWLADKGAARLTFLTVLDQSEHSVDVLGPREQKRVVKTMETVAAGALDQLVARARGTGVDACRRLRFGKGYVEIIRQVIQERHDLVIVGTRDLRTVKRLLLGSTAMKLLRDCPSAVWVTKPGAGPQASLRNVVVASDFSAVTDRALEAAVGLARRAGAKLHLINSVDFPLDRTWFPCPRDEATEQYHNKIRMRAATELRKQLSRVDVRGLDGPVELHVVEGMLTPDVAILKFIKERKIGLVVMGTIGRRGFAGAVIGNTAERLLPQLPCSILAFKPRAFRSPIALG